MRPLTPMNMLINVPADEALHLSFGLGISSKKLSALSLLNLSLRLLLVLALPQRMFMAPTLNLTKIVTWSPWTWIHFSGLEVSSYGSMRPPPSDLLALPLRG